MAAELRIDNVFAGGWKESMLQLQDDYKAIKMGSKVTAVCLREVRWAEYLQAISINLIHTKNKTPDSR